MSDVKKLDERINNLESKLKSVFAEIEAKISSLSTTDKTGIEERFQEVDDLMLLLQLEQMKIKEKLHASADIGFGEEHLSVEDTGDMKTAVDSMQNLVHDMDARLSIVENRTPVMEKRTPAIENKIRAIENRTPAITQPSRSLMLEVSKILSEN